MREAQEEHVALGEVVERREAQPGDAPQIGVDAVGELAGEAFGGDLADFGVRMAQQQPQQLAARVPRRTRNRDADHGRGTARVDSLPEACDDSIADPSGDPMPDPLIDLAFAIR